MKFSHSEPRASFDIALVTDTHIILIDRDEGRSITNDAEAVIPEVDKLVSGIGKRKLYYRDTSNRFDELVVDNAMFIRFKPCSEGQQEQLTKLLKCHNSTI